MNLLYSERVLSISRLHFQSSRFLFLINSFDYMENREGFLFPILLVLS